MPDFERNAYVIKREPINYPIALTIPARGESGRRVAVCTGLVSKWFIHNRAENGPA